MKPARFLVACACAAAAPALAQSYPSKAVRIVVPYEAGGGIDALARGISESLGRKWGQPIIVENRTGAAAIIGTDTVAKAAPDGHTLLVTAEAPITSNPFLFAKLPYDPVRELTPVSQLVSLPQMVVAHSSVSATSLASLVEQAKAKPNALNYASYGSGSLPHLLLEGVKQKGGVEITQIPYKGIIPAMNALVAGEVQLTLLGASLAQPHIKAGKMRALAIARATRLPTLPDVPTIREAGFGDVDPGESWFGLFVTAGSPAGLAERIQKDVAEAFEDPGMRQKFIVARGFDPVFSTPPAFARFIEADMKQKARLISISGAKAE
jgi:tripartite-type tricarboxylate transporter receptor subunit TctC